MFLESKDFEELLHLGVSLGGDSDTLTCIAGGIGEAFYGGIPSFVTKIIHAIPMGKQEIPSDRHHAYLTCLCHPVLTAMPNEQNGASYLPNQNSDTKGHAQLLHSIIGAKPRRF